RSSPRPRLRTSDQLFWVLLCRLWSGWADALAVVKPATVIRWHRSGFTRYWTWKSRRNGLGRPPVSREVHHGCRTHPSLEKDAPEPRPVERPDQSGIVDRPMVGGLHHRYRRLAV